MDKHFAIFDMDGTLVDSMGFWSRLAEEYLQSKGIEQFSPHLREQIKPMTMSQSATLFAETFDLGITAEQAEAEMNAAMDAHYRSDIPLKPGAAAYLERLRQAGVTLCVASSTAEELMDACLTRLGVDRYFAFLLSCEAVGAGKTKPDVYLTAAARLGAPPKDIAVYEDALYAANTAKQAGFYTIAVADDSNRMQWDKLTALTDETVSDWQRAAQML